MENKLALGRDVITIEGIESMQQGELTNVSWIQSLCDADSYTTLTKPLADTVNKGDIIRAWALEHGYPIVDIADLGDDRSA